MTTDRTTHAIAAAIALLGTLVAPAAAAQEEITCNGTPATIVGTPGDDVIHGTGDDVIAGLGGNDLIDGGPVRTYDRSVICGDEGNDELVASGLGGILIGGAGDDVLRGGDPVQVPDGTSFGIALRGGPGNDVLDGRPRNGATTSAARVDFEGAPGPVTIDLARGVATGDGSDTLLDIRHVQGSPFDDLISGHDGVDGINGMGGSDTIFGLGGHDSLAGDFFLRGDGNDTVDGGDGNDSLAGDGGADRLTGGAGDDSFVFLQGRDTLDGGPGTDLADFRDGGPGATIDLAGGTVARGDVHSTIAGVEDVWATMHDDSVTGDGAANVIRGQGGNDFLAAGAGDDSVFGRKGHDVMRGDDGDDSLTGGGGDDSIDGGGGTDRAEGLRGFDTCVRSETYAGCENTGDGPLPPTCLGRVATIVGSRGADRLEGTGERDVIWGGDGDDTIDGAGKADVICGGGGGDRVAGGRGPDSIAGDEGHDVLNGNEGRDDVHGGEGDDRLSTGTSDRGDRGEALFGEAGADTLDSEASDDSTLEGGADDDRLLADAGHAVADGGEGDDFIQATGSHPSVLVLYEDAPGPVVVDLSAGTASGMGSDTLEGVTAVIASPYDDTITGSERGDYVDGRGGDDTLIDPPSGEPGNCLGDDYRGGDGDDTISLGDGCDAADAGDGDDVVRGGDGDDYILDGAGNDEVLGEAGADEIVPGLGTDLLDAGAGGSDAISFAEVGGVDANLTTGVVTSHTYGQTDTIAGFEILVGSSYDDSLTGDDGPNVIRGGPGRDRISGLGGNDQLDGGEGRDAVDGGEGSDTCAGETLTACEA